MQKRLKSNTKDDIPSTVIVKEQIAALPASSLNVYTMVVVPTEKESPGLAVDVDVGITPESSVAVGSVHVTATASPFSVVWTVMSPGQPVMTGPVSSMLAFKKKLHESMCSVTHIHKLTHACMCVHMRQHTHYVCVYLCVYT